MVSAVDTRAKAVMCENNENSGHAVENQALNAVLSEEEQETNKSCINTPKLVEALEDKVLEEDTSEPDDIQVTCKSCRNTGIDFFGKPCGCPAGRKASADKVCEEEATEQEEASKDKVAEGEDATEQDEVPESSKSCGNTGVDYLGKPCSWPAGNKAVEAEGLETEEDVKDACPDNFKPSEAVEAEGLETEEDSKHACPDNFKPSEAVEAEGPEAEEDIKDACPDNFKPSEVACKSCGNTGTDFLGNPCSCQLGLEAFMSSMEELEQILKEQQASNDQGTLDEELSMKEGVCDLKNEHEVANETEQASATLIGSPASQKAHPALGKSWKFRPSVATWFHGESIKAADFPKESVDEIVGEHVGADLPKEFVNAPGKDREEQNVHITGAAQCDVNAHQKGQAARRGRVSARSPSQRSASRQRAATVQHTASATVENKVSQREASSKAEAAQRSPRPGTAGRVEDAGRSGGSPAMRRSSPRPRTPARSHDIIRDTTGTRESAPSRDTAALQQAPQREKMDRTNESLPAAVKRDGKLVSTPCTASTRRSTCTTGGTVSDLTVLPSTVLGASVSSKKMSTEELVALEVEAKRLEVQQMRERNARHMERLAMARSGETGAAKSESSTGAERKLASARAKPDPEAEGKKVSQAPATKQMVRSPSSRAMTRSTTPAQLKTSSPSHPPSSQQAPETAAAKASSRRNTPRGTRSGSSVRTMARTPTKAGKLQLENSTSDSREGAAEQEASVGVDTTPKKITLA